MTSTSSKCSKFLDQGVKSSGFHLLGKCVASVLLVAAFTVSASASPIVGTFDVVAGSVVLSNGLINFSPIGGGLDFNVNTSPATRSGDFSAAAFGVSGNGGVIANLNYSNSIFPDFIALGPGATAVPNWLTLSARPTYNFTLTQLVAGQTLVGFPSPYVLTESGGDLTVSFSVIGTLLETGDVPSNTTFFNGIMRTTYTGTTINALIAQVITNGGNLPANPWSGTFTASTASAVPEPSTMAMMGASLLAAAAYRRKRS